MPPFFMPLSVWNKMIYAFFLHASFCFCPLLFCSFPSLLLSGLMENADYAGLFYAYFRAPILSTLAHPTKCYGIWQF
jgi:hypothetical protein